MNPNLTRLRRSMMFLNAQKPSLIKDPYIYKPDSIMLDLEDAVAENQKDAARYSLYHALKEIDYRGVERVVRINGLETPHWKEDIRVCVAGRCDSIRISKTESAADVLAVEAEMKKAEEEFGVEHGSILIMAALESCKGVMNAYEICTASPLLFGCALSGGDYTKDLQTVITGTGVELQGARQQNWMRECCPLHDPLAMIVAVDPSVVKTHRCVTRIECEGAYCKGMVVTDLREYPIDGEYVNHCMEVDSKKVLDTLFAAFY